MTPAMEHKASINFVCFVCDVTFPRLAELFGLFFSVVKNSSEGPWPPDSNAKLNSFSSAGAGHVASA